MGKQLCLQALAFPHASKHCWQEGGPSGRGLRGEPWVDTELRIWKWHEQTLLSLRCARLALEVSVHVQRCGDMGPRRI